MEVRSRTRFSLFLIAGMVFGVGVHAATRKFRALDDNMVDLIAYRPQLQLVVANWMCRVYLLEVT